MLLFGISKGSKFHIEGPWRCMVEVFTWETKSSPIEEKQSAKQPTGVKTGRGVRASILGTCWEANKGSTTSEQLFWNRCAVEWEANAVCHTL